jgi:hypothetical protein
LPVESADVRLVQGGFLVYKAATLFATLLSLTPLASAADSALLDLIMPDAKIVFGASVSRIVASPLGKNFTSRQEAQVGAAMAGIVMATGFNPARDIQEILVATPGGQKDAPALVLLRGSFDTERVHAFAKSSGARVSSYNGIEMFTGVKNMGVGKADGVVAVLDETIVMAGPPEQVRAAIRNRSQGARISADLKSRIAVLSETYDIWAVSLTPPAGLASRLDDSRAGATADMLKAIQQFSGGVRFGDGLEVAAEILSRTQHDAERLGGGLQTFAAIMQSDPRTACPNCLTIRVEEAAVHISLIVPASLIQQNLQARNKPRVVAPVNTDIVIQSSPADMGTVKLKQ